MSGFISRQPNGLYCRHDDRQHCITNYNMTYEDYVRKGVTSHHNEKSRLNIVNELLRPFEYVIGSYVALNMPEEVFIDILKDMCAPVTSNTVYSTVKF